MTNQKTQTEIDDNINLVTINTREELPNIARHISGPQLINILAQAEQGDTQELFALYRDILTDSQIQSEFVKRKGAVLGDKITLKAWDTTNHDDVAAKEHCDNIIATETFSNSISWLLNATLFPISVLEKIYTYLNGSYHLAKLQRVHYQLLDWTAGYLRIRETDPDGNILPTYIKPTSERYMIHRGVDLPMPDCWGGPMRGLLFWYLLRSMSRQWWADFIERYGQPILLGKFSDDAGKKVLERAFSLAVRLGGLIISKGTEVEIVNAAKGDTTSSHESFIELCNREISKLIVGQTLSANVEATGMGSGTANLQGQVRDDLRQMDGQTLSNTYRHNLFAQSLAINGLVGKPPKIIFGADSTAEIAATMGILKAASEAGLEPTDDGISSVSESTGITFQRRAATSYTPGIPFSAAALSASDPATKKTDDQIATGSAAALSRALGAQYAPLKKIIDTSENPRELIKRAETWALNADLTDVADIINAALTEYIVSGYQSA